MPRESEPKRHRSRFDREPSPKRSRRNGKPTMERSPNKLSTEVRDKDDDRKHHRRLQDPLPLERPPASDSKHDDRRNAVQDGASTGHRGTAERGWWRNHKDDQRGKHQTSSDMLDKDERSVAHGDDNRVQNHDQSSKMNADHSKPAKKKFREEKLPPAESQPEEKAEAEPVKAAHLDGTTAGGGRREERGIHRHSDRTERDRTYYTGGRLPSRARPEKAGGFPSRDRYGSGVHGGRFRGREGYSGRQGYHPGGGRAEKWKHDLFDEVNRSPPKNEEDPVAKVEALLAL